MTTRFTCDLSGAGKPLPHFWEHSVGSGHALLALRQDWQEQLRACRRDLGFRHVRFHGMLDDDMGTLVDEKKEFLYSFHNIDRIYDFLRSIDMRPLVELSFMPKALASGDQTVFHYQGNITPPADYNQWATLVSKLARHWIERYGAAEVCLWPMEVWNEPNLENFWTGSREDYFRLFETTHRAIKQVHPDLRVGGPVTAKNEWISEFLDFCAKAGVPPDFVSTHTYPTDALGSPDDDTETDLSKSHLGILVEHATKSRKKAGDLPLYYTEWSTSSNPRDELHDDPYAAAYVTHAMLSMGEVVDAFSWWTFSDIFEENYFPSKPFQGGFGLLTIHGVPKPVYRAYQLLHRLGEERLDVRGEHETVAAWVARDEQRITVVLVNLALPLHPVEAQTVNLELFGLPAVARTEVRRIDADHGNAKATWRLQGEPRYPSQTQVRDLIDASKLAVESVALAAHGEATTFEVHVAAQSVTTIELYLEPPPKSTKGDTPSATPAPYAFKKADEALLERLQSAAFGYFTQYADPHSGLVADNSKPDSAASISSTGFALSCYPIASERGWLSRKQAAETTLKTLAFLHASRQGEDTRASGYKGFYYHFLDMTSGARAQESELSTIDTAILLAGTLTAAAYFDRASKIEREIRTLCQTLFDRVQWPWTLDKHGKVQESWKPEGGFKKAEWDAYSEALLMYVLGAASPAYPLTRETYAIDAQGYPWRNNAGLEWVQASPLFIHLFPQAWLDLRGLDDGFISSHGPLDYFQNSQRAIAVQRAYAHLNPHGFRGYGTDLWGLSACEGPDGKQQRFDGEMLRGLGYEARGVPHGPDDGTLVPWAAATSLAHAPEAALAALHAVLGRYPHVLREGRFVGAFNPSLPADDTAGWVAPACFGIDQGLVIMMIENARTGLVWELLRHSSAIQRGLKRLNFAGGWMS